MGKKTRFFNSKMEETSRDSRQIWLDEGDRNTKFFHKMTYARRRYNFLNKLEVFGQVVENMDAMRVQLSEFYADLYRERCVERSELEGITLTSLDPDMAEMENTF